jgi:hypothetical protein
MRWRSWRTSSSGGEARSGGAARYFTCTVPPDAVSLPYDAVAQLADKFKRR